MMQNDNTSFHFGNVHQDCGKLQGIANMLDCTRRIDKKTKVMLISELENIAKNIIYELTVIANNGVYEDDVNV